MPLLPRGRTLYTGQRALCALRRRACACGQTEFAKDETFGYHASNLCEYIEEKTGGQVRAGDVTCISLESLRAMDFDGIEPSCWRCTITAM